MNVSSLEGHSYVVVCDLLSSFICDFLLSNPRARQTRIHSGGHECLVIEFLRADQRRLRLLPCTKGGKVTAANGIQQNLHNLELVDLNLKLLLYIYCSISVYLRNPDI